MKFLTLVVISLSILSSYCLFNIFSSPKIYPKEIDHQFFDTQILGPEDFTKISKNLMIISQEDRLDMENPYRESGSLILMDLDSKKTQTIQIQDFIIGQKDEQGLEYTKFHPHGIFFDENSNLLYVINHAFDNTVDRVEVIEIKSNEYETFWNKEISINSLSFKQIHSLSLPESLNGSTNDLMSLQKGSIHITQSFQNPRPIDITKTFSQTTNGINLMMERKKTYVYYCKFDQSQMQSNLDCQKVDKSKSVFNNGINWDRKNNIFVADTKLRQIQVFSLNLEAPQLLDFQYSFKVDCMADNIEYDLESGRIFVSGLQNIIEFTSFAAKSVQKKTQMVLQEENRNMWTAINEIKIVNKQYGSELILSSPEIAYGVSVANFYKDQLILGSFIEKSIIYCDLKQ